MSNNIYMPNIFRVNNYRESTGAEVRIPYYQEFTSDDELKLMMYVKTMKIIENIFLFDKLYVDLFEMPVIVDNMCQMDEDITAELFKKGTISYIDSQEVIVGCTPKQYFSNLSYSSGKLKLINETSELEEMLFSHFKFRSQMTKVLKNTIDNSLYYRYDYGKDLLKKIGKDIDSGIIQKGLNIKTETHKNILNKDVPIINAYGEASRGLYLADKLNIDNVFLDDIIRDAISSKVDYLDANRKVINMNKIFKFFELPDIELMLLYGHITVEDILYIRDLPDFKVFKEWLNTNSDYDKDIIKAYRNEIKKRSKNDIIPKLFRFIIPNAIGCYSTLLGIGASAIDTFLLDKFIKYNDLDNSIETITNELKCRSKNNIQLPNVITDEYRKYYSLVD